MPRANLEAVVAKYEGKEPAAAEPAPDKSSAPPAGVSEAGSASADATQTETSASANSADGASPADATKPLDHDELKAKLKADRDRRQIKTLRKQTKAEAEAAKKAREEAEADAAKRKNMTWLERIKAEGKDPRQAFEEMKTEAKKAGTPEAQLEAIEKAFDAKLQTALSEHVEPLKKTIAELTKERDDLRRQSEDRGFVDDVRRAISEPEYAPLLEEYEPNDLLRLARRLSQNPRAIFDAATSLGVDLTEDDGTFTMKDIFNVMLATQAAHVSKKQRRTQSAASQTSEAAPTQATQAKPPVNGTVERKAAVTITNDLATSRASEVEKLKGMTKEQRRAYLEKKYPGVD